MDKSRLEAFTDGVIAIIITVMVLELHVPHGDDLHALLGTWHQFVVYLASFVTVAVYWHSHHYLFSRVQTVSRATLWLNTMFLLALSFFPFATAWVGDTNLIALVPEQLYGVVLLIADVVFTLMVASILRNGANPILTTTLRKSEWSITGNVVAIGVGWIWPPLTLIIDVLILTNWLLPDRLLLRKDNQK
ncbi:TMEM175 family protein [Lacticaseibacillus thailandensis]|uniref:Integral membrane protein n=1 Tax=Lacticaseibacillus thailandensis DSM 22698 = JCM 13996 TaxID=1423810 RepID=A0A0R2C7R0_9LACO|nr:TMEM175 family protein [Lacticaseibacillus thailandensis]KRM87376.1 integral membrane protein [Lacticaseibacillus thailandensis DSM 22698 = JCM 13996]